MIPARLHFCWIGTSVPWAYVFAVLSAAERSALADIVLHHTDELENGPELRALHGASRVHLSRIDPIGVLDGVGLQLGVGAGELARLYDRLESPVMRSDVLRAAILYQHGGIYLDLDTITVAPLTPLLGASQFVGSEFIVWPYRVRTSHSPVLKAGHLALALLRRTLRWMPRGWKAFRRVEGLYVRGVNNAIMGAQAGSPLMADYLRAMMSLPAKRSTQAYAIGPDLLQDVVDRCDYDDFRIQEPAMFCPLAPEISEHWFRIGRGRRLECVLPRETRVVHWYASIRNKSRVARISPDYVRQHRGDQFYSMLVSSCISGLGELG